MIAETCHVRPSEILDPEDELTYVDKILLDIRVLTSRSKEADQTLSPGEAKEYEEMIRNRHGI